MSIVQLGFGFTGSMVGLSLPDPLLTALHSGARVSD